MSAAISVAWSRSIDDVATMAAKRAKRVRGAAPRNVQSVEERRDELFREALAAAHQLAWTYSDALRDPLVAASLTLATAALLVLAGDDDPETIDRVRRAHRVLQGAATTEEEGVVKRKLVRMLTLAPEGWNRDHLVAIHPAFTKVPSRAVASIQKELGARELATTGAVVELMNYARLFAGATGARRTLPKRVRQARQSEIGEIIREMERAGALPRRTRPTRSPP